MLARAQGLAGELFAAALEVDAAPLLPRARLSRLADAGLYGVAGDDVSFADAFDCATALASGCLTTTLVWVQHHGVVRRVAMSRGEVRERWLEDLLAGRVRASVGLAALRSADSVVARTEGSVIVVDGRLPWMTGWGLADVVLLAARDGEDLLWLLVDLPAGEAEPLEMVALNASGTVTVAFDGLRVAADRLLARLPASEAGGDGDGSGLVFNGALALGVASRCCALLDDGVLDGLVAPARDALLAAPGDLAAVAEARAEASLLALRAAARLMAASGARGVMRGGHPERLAREAALLLSFGQRPAIQDALLSRLSAPGSSGPAARNVPGSPS